MAAEPASENWPSNQLSKAVTKGYWCHRWASLHSISSMDRSMNTASSSNCRCFSALEMKNKKTFGAVLVVPSSNYSHSSVKHLIGWCCHNGLNCSMYNVINYLGSPTWNDVERIKSRLHVASVVLWAHAAVVQKLPPTVVLHKSWCLPMLCMAWFWDVSGCPRSVCQDF